MRIALAPRDHNGKEIFQAATINADAADLRAFQDRSQVEPRFSRTFPEFGAGPVIALEREADLNQD